MTHISKIVNVNTVKEQNIVWYIRATCVVTIFIFTINVLIKGVVIANTLGGWFNSVNNNRHITMCHKS